MIKKDLVEKQIKEAMAVAEKYDLTGAADELVQLMNISKEFKVHMLLIGGFSAGKSALTNKFIGKDILKEDIEPETALATEIRFSENERIEAVLLSGEKTAVSDVAKVDTDKVKNLVYYVDSENVKLCADYIIVDTPGFDSGVEKHNKALMQYIDEGTAFVLVVDCLKGTLSESVLNFVGEIAHYSTDIGLIITKCDKAAPSQIEKVKAQMLEQLEAVCGMTVPCVCTSKHDDEAGRKIVDMVRRFSPQELYEKNIGGMAEGKATVIIDALELVKANAHGTEASFDAEIAEREKAKATVLRQLELQKKQIKSRLRFEVKERIMGRVSQALMNGANDLVMAYQCGTTEFQNHVMGIIRPVLISEIEEYSEAAFNSVVENLNVACMENVAEKDKPEEILSGIIGKLYELNEKNIGRVPVEIKQDKVFDEKKTGDAYKAITSVLAVATEAVAPWLELVIIFLPDIIKFLSAIFGESKEEQLYKAMVNKVIPQIVSKLRENLDKVLSEVEEGMIASVEESVAEIIETTNEALNAAKQKKAAAKDEFEAYIADIDKDIARLRGCSDGTDL